MIPLLSTLICYLPMFLDCYLIYRLYGYTLEYRYDPQYRIFSILPVFGLLFLRYQLTLSGFFTNSFFSFFDTILLYLTFFSVCILFYKNSLAAKVLWTFISLLVLALGEVTTFMLLGLLQIPTSKILENDNLYTAISIAAKLVSLLLIELIRRLKSRTLLVPRYARFEICGIIVIDLFLLIFSVRIFQTNTPSINKELILTMLYVLCFAMSILTFTIIFKLSHRAEEELEEKLLIRQLEMENKMNDDMTTVLETLRSLRHDMNNHIGAMQGLASARQFDALQEYINEMYQDVSPANEFVFAKNRALSALLYNKTLNAKHKQIDFEPVISVSDFSIPDKDMCSLLGNLLDNAIEANEKVTGHKYIELIICQTGKDYSIRCSNTFHDIPVNINGNFITTKKSKELHGIGTKNIKAIVQKYGGSLIFSYQDLFRVDITLPCSQDD